MILKWAGGKRRLLPQIKQFLPSNIGEIDTYIEPFFGGGAVFFALQNEYKFKKSYISDINVTLMMFYQFVKTNPGTLIQEFNILQDAFYNSQDPRSFYYDILAKYNHSMLNADDYNTVSTIELITYFMLINKTCFNGLITYNDKGELNSTYCFNGKQSDLFDYEKIYKCSELLQSTVIKTENYNALFRKSHDNSFTYLDPQYVEVNKQHKKLYNKQQFTNEMQEKLAERLIHLRGKWMLSNSYCDYTLDLYKDYNINVVTTKRLINGISEYRKEVKEIIVTNYAE